MDSDQTQSMLAMLTGTPDHACRLAVMAAGAEGLLTGLHLVDGEARQMALVRQGDARGDLATACLGQRFVGRGSLIALMLSDLDTLQGRFGPGGYRRALLDSGRMGHRAYLGATALGLSACGVGAFFDDETADVLGLSKTSRLLYLVVTG
jgi:SagB-type dehydrogenase family enzyme